MTSSSWRLALLLMVGLINVNCASAAKQRSIETPSAPMTAGQARAALVDSIKHTSANFVRVDKFTIHHDKVTYVWAKGDPRQKNLRLRFAEVSSLSIRDSWGSTINVMVNGKETVFYWARSDKHHATNFIDAVLTLKQAMLTSPDTEEADFAASAKVWLATTPKPEMSDDARAYRLLAEDAFKRKDFSAALDAYGDALNLYSMWPEGHFNAALLAAEIQDYDLAARHMHRYLVLAPDAKDAVAAKDKLLLWQLKAKE